MEGSHRAALIHPGARQVKTWSYQSCVGTDMRIVCVNGGNLRVVSSVESRNCDRSGEDTNGCAQSRREFRAARDWFSGGHVDAGEDRGGGCDNSSADEWTVWLSSR